VETLSAITKRRAYRALSEEPIEKETLIRLAKAARLTPSSGNNQPWRIVTVVEPIQLEKLKKTLTGGNYWALKAPAITAFITNKMWSLQMDKREFAYFELGMAAMSYQLQAVQENLIVHPMAGFDQNLAKEVLGVDEDEVLFVLVALGKKGDSSYLSEKHLAQETSVQVRKPLEDIFAFNSWNEHLNP